MSLPRRVGRFAGKEEYTLVNREKVKVQQIISGEYS